MINMWLQTQGAVANSYLLDVPSTSDSPGPPAQVYASLCNCLINNRACCLVNCTNILYMMFLIQF